METYSIHEVEQLTGIKAHTLRIWEKRYNTLIPHRTPTQIRYYDDAQLRKLLNITTLLKNGHKISALMEMPDKKMHEFITGLVNSDRSGTLYDVYVNNFIAAMLDFDEPLFDKTFSDAFIGFGVYDTVVKIVYPFLSKTGVLWSINNATPAQEHFASNIIRRKLLNAINNIPYAADATKKLLLFLPAGELHEIGLLFSDFILRSAGYETIYLGQNVPQSTLLAAIKKIKPHYLLTFLAPGAGNRLGELPLSDITKAFPKQKIIVCSGADYTAAHPGVIFVTHPDMLLNSL